MITDCCTIEWARARGSDPCVMRLVQMTVNERSHLVFKVWGVDLEHSDGDDRLDLVDQLIHRSSRSACGLSSESSGNKLCYKAGDLCDRVVGDVMLKLLDILIFRQVEAKIVCACRWPLEVNREDFLGVDKLLRKIANDIRQSESIGYVLVVFYQEVPLK